MKKSKVKRNIIIGFGGQAITIILGIIIPRIMIVSYGSDVNGLISTLTYIFSYMALLEAGIGQAAKNALMKPLSANDKEGVSFISSAADRYYKRFTLYYGIGVILLAFVCPFVIKTEVNKLTVFAVFILEGFSGVLSFSQIQTISCVLTADGRGYINNGLIVVNKIISYLVKIIMAYFGVNIVILEAAYFLITVAKVIFYKSYFKKRYPWIDLKSSPKDVKLPDRNSYVLTEIAWTIFSSTDMIVLSVFVGTKQSSVYGVYSMIFSNIGLLLNTVYLSLSYVLGQSFHKDIERYKRLHDAFTSIFLGGMTCLICTAYILTIPFIQLYTKGVSDVNYIFPLLPLLFSLVQVISWSRYVTGNLSGIAGYAKITSWISLIEAAVNIILSIVLVNKFGIVGVLFATVIALPIKVIFLTVLSEYKILKRNPAKYLLILFSNYAYFGCVIFVSKFIHFNISSYWSFAIHGIVVLLCCLLIGIVLNCIVNKDLIKLLKERKR